MKLFSIILSFFLFSCLNSYAQKGDARKGYIVDNDGNRLEGFVQSYNDEVEYEVKVRFKEDENAKKYVLHKPKNVSSYGFEEIRENNLGADYTHWRHFIRYEMDRPAKLFASNSSFIEKVVEGELDLYQFLYDTASDVEKPVTTRYIVVRDGEELYQIEEEDFKKHTKELFSDYGALKNSLGELKFRFHNLPRMIDDYNYWLENQHDSNTYKMNPIIFTQ